MRACHEVAHPSDPTSVCSIVLGLGLGWMVARLPFSETPEELRMHVALCSGLGATSAPLFLLKA